MRLILASGSPRRRDLLKQIGVTFETGPSDAEEVRNPEESPEAYVLRVAKAKAADVLPRYPAGTWVLGADTEVVLNNQVFGKPESCDNSLLMLRKLSGLTHKVLSSVCLLRNSGQEAEDLEVRSTIVTTLVTFKALTDDEIMAYWQTGEPVGKAGSYAIQGLGAVFVSRIEGSFSGVVGLPLAETAALFSETGIPFGLVVA